MWRAFQGVLVGFVVVFCAPVHAQIVLNEVHPHGELVDLTGGESDWIELRNTGSDVQSLSGLYLSDDPDEWMKWPLPDVEMAPGDHVVFHASGRDLRALHHWECPVRDQDAWRYLLPEGPLLSDWRLPDFDDAGWGEAYGGFGYGDGDDLTELPGAEVIFLRRTFSVADLGSLIHGLMAVDYDDGCVVFLNGREMFRSSTMEGQGLGHDVWAAGIHEAVLYQGGQPEQVRFDPREWLVEGPNVLAVQVHNDNPGSSDLTIRPFLALARSEAALVPFNVPPTWLGLETPAWHTNFKLKPGEPVILSDAAGNLLDLATLPAEAPNGWSLGRASDGEAWRWFSEPTPGDSNGAQGGLGILPPPDVTESGFFSEAPLVVASPGTASGGPGQDLPPMVLRYTVDGREPTEDSPVFTGSWSPTETTVLSVKAFALGWVPSATVDRTYVIGEPATGLEAVSILTHPDHLWDWETGIYVMGPNAGADYPHLGANFWQPWSRESRLEWFGEGGEKVAESRFDLEIHGGWSRAEPQRSFRLDFKPKWTGKLEHTVFPSKPEIQAFGNLNLRNGGQASWENKIQDAFYSELALQTEVVAAAWRPVEVYLNGMYWGIYGAREKSDEQFVEDNFGWDETGVDLHNQWNVLSGSPTAWETAVDPLLAMADGADSFRQGFEGQFDVGSYFDYHIFEIHGQNVDWMTAPWGVKNLKYFRSLSDGGKWRPILYDTDACFGAWGTSPWENYLALAVAPPFPSRYSELFRKVLVDPELGCGFATRYCDLLATAFDPARFNAGLDTAATWIAPAMERHIDLWDSPATYDYWQFRLDLMRNHNADRIEPSRVQLREHFGWEAPRWVTVDWALPEGGEVQVNGMSGLGNGWEGAYFGECPIRLAALPAPGYGFLGWEDNVHSGLGLVDVQSPFLEVGLEQSDLFKAQFGPCLEGVDVAIVEGGFGLEAVVTGSAQPLTLQWWLNGALVEVGPTWSGSEQEGLVVTASNGTCTVFSSLGPVDAVGLGSPLSGLSALQAWPNPARDVVRIEGRGRQLTVVSATGQVQHQQAVASWPVRLDLTGWPAGVYVLLAEGAEGVLTSRCVVE